MEVGTVLSQIFYRGKNVTLIGVSATLGFLAPFTFEGWTNKEAFLTYVTEVLAPHLWTGARASNG